jgi:hypothetical protein
MIYSTQAVAVGGNTALAQGCDDLAIDGFLITGIILAYQFAAVDYTIALTPTPANAGNY